MQWWIGYHREIGQLSPAPEFGDDGTWPPVSTPWVVLRWELFEATPNEISTNEALNLLYSYGPELPEDERDALSPNFLNVVFGQLPSYVINKRAKWTELAVTLVLDSSGGYRENVRREEVRRLVHYVRWRRNDPVTQLPPDAVQETSYSVTTGLSAERSQTLAQSLGVKGAASGMAIHATLTKQLQQQFGLKLEITEQEQRTHKLTLTNQSSGYRLFALWRVEHLIAVDALAAKPEQLGTTTKLRHSWLPRANVQFVTNTDPVITYKDIATGRG